MKMMSQEDFKSEMELINYDPKEFLIVRYSVIKLLQDASSACVFSFLMEMVRRMLYHDVGKEILRRERFWFRCPLKFMKAMLGLGERRLRSSITKLQKNGLIETDRRDGNEQWVRIDINFLQELAESEE